MYTTTKINNKKIKRIPVLQEDTRPIYGSDVIPILHSNIYVLSKKFTGKSTLLYHIVKNCVNKDTVFYGFVSTHDKDNAYLQMKNLLDRKKCEYHFYDNMDELSSVVEAMSEYQPEEEDEEEQDEPEMTVDIYDDEYYSAAVTTRKRKKKYQHQKFFLLFDDISQELSKNTTLPALMKRNRHLRSKIVIASQYLNDIPPQARVNLDGICIGKGVSRNKVIEAHRYLDVPVDADTFWDMYMQATQQPYTFFVVFPSLNQFRINFDTAIAA